jgi:hypothetical protein
VKNTDWESHRKKIEEMMRAARPWEAREYGLSILGHFAEEEELRLLLGRVFHEMRDLRQAGLLWMTTREESPEAKRAIDCAIDEYGDRLPHALKKPLQRIRYPDEIARRIDETCKRAGVEEGINVIRPYDAVWDRESGTWVSRKTHGWEHPGNRRMALTCMSVFIPLAFLALVGIFFWTMKILGWVF